jgi:hypothetical protein
MEIYMRMVALIPYLLNEVYVLVYFVHMLKLCIHRYVPYVCLSVCIYAAKIIAGQKYPAEGRRESRFCRAPKRESVPGVGRHASQSDVCA